MKRLMLSLAIALLVTGCSRSAIVGGSADHRSSEPSPAMRQASPVPKNVHLTAAWTAFSAGDYVGAIRRCKTCLDSQGWKPRFLIARSYLRLAGSGPDGLPALRLARKWARESRQFPDCDEVAVEAFLTDLETSIADREDETGSAAGESAGGGTWAGPHDLPAPASTPQLHTPPYGPQWQPPPPRPVRLPPMMMPRIPWRPVGRRF